MWHRISSFAQTVAGGTVIIALASLVSRVVGLVRDNLFTHTFGAGATLDMYNAAFKVPDFIFNVIVLGALSASFVPVYIERRIKASEDDAYHLVGAVFILLTVALLVLTMVGWFLADPPFFWKYGWSDQSSRNSARASSQLLILYSPVKVNSLTFCATPVEKPSMSSKNSRRPATAYFFLKA